MEKTNSYKVPSHTPQLGKIRTGQSPLRSIEDHNLRILWAPSLLPGEIKISKKTIPFERKEKEGNRYTKVRKKKGQKKRKKGGNKINNKEEKKI